MIKPFMKHSFPPIFILLFLCLPSLLQGMTFNGYQIRDLYTNDDTFITDSETWTATALRNGIPYSICNGTYIVGGYDVLGVAGTNWGVQGYYFERTYNDLPPHNIIHYTMSLWLIDSWDPVPPDYFQIQFDSIIAEGWSVGMGNFTANYCGSSDWPDLPNMTIFGEISHSGSSLTLRIISQLDSYAIDESLGFRDINLIFTNSTESDVNEICGLSQIPLPSHQCSCSYDEYFDLDASACQICDPSCRSCFGETPQDCYECQVGHSFVGEECVRCDESCADCSGPNANECIDCFSGMSLFNDGICVSDCAKTSLVSGSILICDQPCDDTGGFLYWDGTCNSLCPFPLQGETGVCLYNCGLQEFLYWDGSCSEACNGSFVPNMFKSRQFCQHPCLDPTAYIYWKGTCESTCPSPLQSSNDGKASYCDLPCAEGQFLSQDGVTCLDSCDPPFLTREEDGINYCEFPCNSSDYLYWNGSCLDSCPSPYKPSSGGPGIQFCSYLCEQYGEYYYPVGGECLSNCGTFLTPEIQIVDDHTWYVICVNKMMMGKYSGDTDDEDEEEEEESRGPLYYPITAVKIASERIAGVFIALDIVVSLLRDSHVMILILVIKILNFIRYMDIRVPPQLMQEIRTFDHNYFYLNFGPDMTEAVKDKFTKIPLPMVFERVGLHSSFLVNFFKPITSFLIILGMIILITILQRWLRKKTPQNQYILTKIILRRLDIFFKWNLVVFLVICNVDEIVLFGIIQWKTVSKDSIQDIISFSVSLVMVIVLFCVFITPFYLLHKISKARFRVLSNQANEPYFNLLKKIERFQLLWKDFKDSSWSQKSFLSIYIFRIALIFLIIALLYRDPLLQAILLFSLSVMMLIFMCIAKPFLKTLDFIKAVIYEICMLIVIGNVLILAALDAGHVSGEQLWLFLGDCIMFCNIWVCLTGVVFFVIKLCRRGQSLWKIYKSMPKPRVWLEFWLLVLQENDPISEELRRNKKTSSKLDLKGLEKEIERKNLASYGICLPEPDGIESSNDEIRQSYIPRKSELRIRRSLFSVRRPSSDSEGSPVKTASTFDGEKSPCSAAASTDQFKLSNKGAEIKKNSQDSSAKIAGSNKSDSPKILVNGNEKDDFQRKFLWKGLETIKEIDSMEISGMKSDQQTKRLAYVLQDTLRGDLSLLSVANKRLSSETVMQKTEEVEIVLEKIEMIKKKWTTKVENAPLQESLFQ